MSKIIYHYFACKSLGEGPRLLFVYGDQEFEDVRYTDDTWESFKSKTKFGAMPVMFMDGKQYAQSIAISRYLGHKYGLAGATLEENLQIDEIVDFVNDIREKAAKVQYETDEVVKEKKHEHNSKHVYPELFAKLNAVIAQNNGHVACGKLTWGDFWVAGIIDYLQVMVRVPDLKQKYPGLQKVIDTVYSIPKIKKYADAAPPSLYGY